MIRRLGFLCAGLLALFSTNLSALSIDTTSRAAVTDAYNNIYLAARSISSGWNGNVGNCNAGTTSLAHQKATINTANFYRALAGLPPVYLISDSPADSSSVPVVVNNAEVVNRARQAALISSANPPNRFTHYPDNTYTCYTLEGLQGAAASNLSLGWGGPASAANATGPSAIDGYINDSGDHNEELGHRRWILYSHQVGLATGDIFNPAGQSSNALRVLPARNSPPGGALVEPSNLFSANAPVSGADWIAWPSPHFVPYELIPSSNRWSISYPGADFSNASVMMTTSDGASVTLSSVEDISADPGFILGDNTLRFEPTGLPSFGAGMTDTSYKIEVFNVIDAGTPYYSYYCYTVTVFDPESAGSATAPDLCKASQTLTFSTTPPSDAAVGGVYGVYVSSDSWSGLPITLSIDPASASVCTIFDISQEYNSTRATVRFTGAGTCIINADQAGNAHYAPSAQEQQAIVVAATAAGTNIIDLNNATPPSTGIGWVYLRDVYLSGQHFDNVYLILDAADVIVRNSNTGNRRRLEVEADATATITLDGMSITGLEWGQSALLLNAGANVRLILADNTTNTLTAGNSSAGIQTTDATLTIEGETNGTGILYANGEYGGAGIGGSGLSGNGGNITINSGRITAVSDYAGAGIGDGSTYLGSNGSNITINGGTIDATSTFGAGIGGGNSYFASSGGSITINGGDITATSFGGAGIGGAAGSDGGNITISGGTITAKTGFTGAGIGGGANAAGGDITISGGIIHASTEMGAGIGGGFGGAGGNITISGGTITANGGGANGSIWGFGAGIGGGGGGGDGGNILIYGEDTRVTAKAKSAVAQDIGAGTTGTSSVHNPAGNVFVALPQGKLTLSTTPSPTPNAVLFTATPTSSDVVTATLPSPFDAAPFTVGGEYELLTGLDQVGKTLSVITTFGAADEIAFALSGYNVNPDPATGSYLRTANAQVNFTQASTALITINTQPAGSTVLTQGATANLTIAATVSPTGTLEYQWYSNTTNSNTGGTLIPGATNESFPIPTATTGTYFYYCVVSATGATSVASGVATVTVNAVVDAETPTITTQPVDATYILNAVATPLTVAASVSDGGTLSYQWYRNLTSSTSGGTLVGTNSNSYTPDTSGPPGTLYYYAVVTNTNSGVSGTPTATATSAVAAITVNFNLIGSNTIDLSIANPPSTGIGWTYSGGTNGVYTILDGADVIVINSNAGSQRRLVVAADAVATITLNDMSITGLAANQSALLLNAGAEVTLILADGTTNTLTAGLNGAGIQTIGATLTIEGETDDTGVLNATGGGTSSGGAGIGGSAGYAGGNITINGGTVIAKGGAHSAGMGGGSGGGAGGTITINGGTVTASAGTGNGAGIGGGYQGVSGTITITGGMVTATAGTGGTGGGAGIGGGSHTTNSGGNITISGGTVTANAGTSGSGGGAGIGSGTSSSSVGNILIYGENTRVTAKRSGTIANTQDIGHGGNASAIANVFVALPQGNLLGTGDLEIGNPVLFTATPTSADVVTVTLPSPFNAAPFTVGGEYELLTGLDQVGKTLSVITTFGATDNIAFALNGYNANPDPATGSHLMTSGAQVNFTVPAATVTGIAVLSQPTTLSYTEGHILNLAGLVVKLTYSDGSSATVPFADFVAEGITTHPTHGTTLTLAHNATQVIVTHTASGETAVTNALIVYAATLDSIAVTTMPTKTTYTVGENLDLAGLVITATYSNSSTSVVTGYTTDPAGGATLNTVGTQTVTVTYTEGGLSRDTSFSVTVYAATLESIAVTTMPTKTTYTVGENLDLAGLVITATYSNSSTSVVTGYTTDPAGGATLNTVGTQTVTVTYTEGAQSRSTSFGVTVNTPAVGSNTIDLSIVNPPTSGDGWTYSGSVYTIEDGADVTVINSNAGSQRRLVVAADAEATITLDNMSITGLGANQSALLLNAGADVTLILADNTTNTLTAGNGGAGIQTTGATLTIEGKTDDTGVLNATGGGNGAGIGSSSSGSSGSHITIKSGTVNARASGAAPASGTGYAAGIGGGNGHSGGTITIIGGIVTAEGSNSGAGIGGGNQAHGGQISIGGNAEVTAVGGWGAAAIGGGFNGAGGTITIIDNAQVSATGGSVTLQGGGGAGIGSGGTTSTSPVSAGAITIATTGVIHATGGAGITAGGITYSDGANIGVGGYRNGAPVSISLYTITASAGVGGSISPLGTVTVSEGADVAFAITADSGDTIASVLVDGVNDLAAVASGSYTFTNVSGDHTIEATFSSGTATLESIAVTTMPTKTTYTVGENLDLAGLVITATYSNSNTSVVTGYTTNPAGGATLNTVGTQAVTVTYEEGGLSRSTSFSVTVNAATLESIAVTTQPTLSYTEGQNLDLSGLVVTLNYSDGSTEDVAFADFVAKGITTSPSHGVALTVATHHNTVVTVTHTDSGETATTDPLTVTAATTFGLNPASVTLTNATAQSVAATGTATGAITVGTLSPANANISVTPTATGVNVAFTGTLPHAGAPAAIVSGPHTITVTRKGVNETLTISVNIPAYVPAPTYSISLNPATDHDFGTVQVGYAAQAAHYVEITNTGNQPTGQLIIAVTGTNWTNFTLSGASITDIAVGGNDSFEVTPNMGLPVGTYTATVTVGGNNGISESFNVSFTVASPPQPPPAPPVITTASGALANGTVGVAYNVILAATNNPTSWAVSAGALPAGLSLNNSGEISGTPTTVETANFSVTATNGDGASAAVAFSITVNAAPFVDLSHDVPVDPYIFTSQTEGYAAVTPLRVTVSNDGNTASGTLTVTLIGTGFTITNDNVDGNTIAAAIAGTPGTETFEIAPNNNLGTGTYDATVEIEDAVNSITLSFDVSFTVTPAGPAALTGTATIDNMNPRIGDMLTGSLVSGNNTGTLSYEWFVDGASTGAASPTNDTYTVDVADLGKAITLEITSSVETGTLTSAATAAVLKKAAPAAPAAPTLDSKTHDSVTLVGNAAYEFSRDGTTWQVSNVFGGLMPSTPYSFYQRIAETADTYASLASPALNETTNAAPPAPPPPPIASAAITVPTPIVAATPAITASGCGPGFTCAVSWLPNDNPFRAGVAYTVMVTLTADFGDEFDPGLVVSINGVNVTATLSNGNMTATASRTFSPLGAGSTTAPIPVLNPVGLLLLVLMLGGMAFRQRRRKM